MNEVSLRQVDALIRGASLAGFEVKQPLVGTEAFTEWSRDPGGRISWDAFVDFFATYGKAVGGNEGLTRVGCEWHRLFPWITTIARTFPTPRDFYRFILGPVSTSAYAHLATGVSDDGEGVRFDFSLGAHRDCPEFSYINEEVFSGFARHFGAEPTRVRKTYKLGVTSYFIELPVLPHSVAEPPHDDVFAITSELEAAHAAVIATYQSLKDTESLSDSLRFIERLSALGGKWKLTARESQVLRALVTGATNRSIAEDLGCRESTVEVHLGRLLDKSAARSRSRLIAFFWANP